MEHAQGFSHYLDVEKGRGVNTIEGYLGDVQRFRKWLDERPEEGLTIGWVDVQTRHIRAYLSDLQPSPSYFHRIHSSLKAWFDYLVNIEQAVESNPVTEIGKPKKKNHHPPTLTVDEVRRMIEMAVEKSRPSERVRNWSLIAVLFGTGLRVSELVSMNDSSIKYRDGLPNRVTIIGKGNKERTIPLSKNARTALHQWLRYRSKLIDELPPGSDTQAIWIVPAGTYKGKRLTIRSVHKMLERFRNHANIQKTVNPHKLRHTFATEAIRNGAKLHAVRDALGHADLSTTGKYLYADQTELDAVAASLPDVLGNAKEDDEQLPGTQMLFDDIGVLESDA